MYAVQWLAHCEPESPWEAEVSTFASLLLLSILSLSSCTDGSSSFSIKQTPELNSQRAGNLGELITFPLKLWRLSAEALRDRENLRAWIKSLVFCLGLRGFTEEGEDVHTHSAALLCLAHVDTLSRSNLSLWVGLLYLSFKKEKKERENLGFALQCEFVDFLFLAFIHKPCGRKGDL